MGTTYKPEETRKRRSKDKALKDLVPASGSLQKLIESHSCEDIERNITKRSKKTK